MTYEYRVLIDGVPSFLGWTRSYTEATTSAIAFREVNPRAIVAIEISPWSFIMDGYTEKWECPGCEYVACPSNQRGI